MISDDEDGRADDHPLEPLGRRHGLQADDEEDREGDHVAHAIEGDAAQRATARHRRLAAEPAGAHHLADADGEDVVAREPAEHHLVEAAQAETCGVFAIFRQRMAWRRYPDMNVDDASRTSPTSASRRAARTASGSASLIASQRKIALIARPPRAMSTRLRVIYTSSSRPS